MGKNSRKQLLQWIFALVLGFAIVNALCFFYERPAGWLDTPAGAAPAAWQPGALIVHGTEGYGVSRVDENGFLNPEGTLADRYVLNQADDAEEQKWGRTLAILLERPAILTKLKPSP